MVPLQARVDMGAMAMKRYSAFPKTPELLESHHHIVCYIWDTCCKGLTPLQRCSQCILQPQPTGQIDKGIHIWQSLTGNCFGFLISLDNAPVIHHFLVIGLQVNTGKIFNS